MKNKEKKNQNPENFGGRQLSWGRIIRHGSSFAGFLFLVFVVLIPSSLRAKNVPAQTEQVAKATLRVNNQAGISAHSLGVIKREMRRIAAEAGVELDWLDCTKSETGAALAERCNALIGEAEYVLNIRKSAESATRTVFQTALGHSWVTREGGVYSSIFAEAIHSLPAREDFKDIILGHAAAHEFGHLLLGGEAHSRQGIMRTQWNKQDWTAMSVGMLRFSREEGKRMRDRILLQK
jgi:hypothetical protein